MTNSGAFLQEEPSSARVRGFISCARAFRGVAPWGTLLRRIPSLCTILMGKHPVLVLTSICRDGGGVCLHG